MIQWIEKNIIAWICGSIIKYYRFKSNRIKDNSTSKNQKYVHFSIDDTIEIFKDLTCNLNNYNSIFDNKELAYLKVLHDCYDIKVCLYCFFEEENGFNISQLSDFYAKEFRNNSTWLKVGFHGKNCKTFYDEVSKEEAISDYNNMMLEFKRIFGGVDSISRNVRLSSFRGNKNIIFALRECEYGIKGLFTADDERKSYYLSDEECLSTNKFLKDELMFFQSDFRVEKIKYNQINEFIEKKQCVFFTHEYFLCNYKIQTRLEKILLQIKKNGSNYSFLE